MNFAHVKFRINELHLQKATVPVIQIEGFEPRNEKDFNPLHVYTVEWTLDNGRSVNLRGTVCFVGSK